MHEIDVLAERAVEQRIFPGLVLQVTQDGKTVLHRAYGSTMYDDPGSQPVSTTTVYDLASLTKVYTATAALILSEQGGLRLERSVGYYLAGAQRDVTIQQLLTHTSGLDLQLSRLRDLAPERLTAQVLAAQPLVPPGTQLAYANVNSLLLGMVVAAVFGADLSTVLQQLLWQPLGLTQTAFNPPDEQRAQIAPTEIDEEWRSMLVQGVVHDDSAYALGGITGHAGLFAPADDVTRFLRLWCEDGTYAGRQLLQPATIAAATRDVTSQLPVRYGLPLARGLGWMLAGGPFISAAAAAGGYGHTGFTGPIMLVVPQRRLTVSLLCNRTYPRRTPPPHRHQQIAAEMVRELLRVV